MPLDFGWLATPPCSSCICSSTNSKKPSDRLRWNRCFHQTSWKRAVDYHMRQSSEENVWCDVASGLLFILMPLFHAKKQWMYKCVHTYHHLYTTQPQECPGYAGELFATYLPQSNHSKIKNWRAVQLGTLAAIHRKIPTIPLTHMRQQLEGKHTTLSLYWVTQFDESHVGLKWFGASASQTYLFLVEGHWLGPQLSNLGVHTLSSHVMAIGQLTSLQTW